GDHLNACARAWRPPRLQLGTQRGDTRDGDLPTRGRWKRSERAQRGFTRRRGAIGECMAHVSELPTLLVDDEPQLLHSASIALRGAGIPDVITVDDSRAVMAVMAEREVGAVVLDLAMPHLPGRVLLDQVATEYPDVPIIVMTATDDVGTAVQC